MDDKSAAPKPPETPQTPEVPETPDIPEIPDVPEVPAGPDAPKLPNVPDISSLHPDGSELRSLAGDCVHCGFCLPACPTYQLWGEEMDSPRGRIHLVAQVLDGATMTDAAAEHFDRCLGCMACMTACPSGVQYDRLIEVARVWTEDARQHPAGAATAPPNVAPGSGNGASVATSAGARAANSAEAANDAGAEGEPAGRPKTLPRSWPSSGRLRERAVRAAIFSVFPYPRRLRVLVGPLRAAQRTGLDKLIARSGIPGRISPSFDAAMRLAPQRPGRPQRRRPAASTGAPLPERVAARGTRRAVVGMLTGCVQSVFFPQVNAATARVLAAEGCDVIIPRGQGCCGALSLHSGREAEAAAFARQTIATFEQAGVDAIVVNSAGCGSAMKEYARLLARDADWGPRAAALSSKVRDFSEFLAELFDTSGGPVAERHPLNITAAYHDACHLAHAQRIRAQPRRLLHAIPGLQLVEIPEGGNCCGSAGIYNLLQPEAASELGARKAESVQSTGASLLISANPGCSMQISSALTARGGHIAVAHTAEVLDASISGLTAAALTSR
jgi:glycolate oxidase iron-sulfur subunit